MRNNKRSVWIIAIWSFAAILILPTISSFATVQSDVRSNANSQCEEACDDAYEEEDKECAKQYKECEESCRSSSSASAYFACMVGCDTRDDQCTGQAARVWGYCMANCGD